MEDSLIQNMPKERAEELLSKGVVKAYQPHQYFLREGEVPLKMAYVMDGVFRYVYLKDNGWEYTKALITPPSFLASYSAMIQEKPSHFFIEALTPSTILEFSYSTWIQLRKEHPFWDQLLIKMLEKGFSIKENRERELLLLDAEARYKNFLQAYPELEGKIKQQIIASYLGIQPESLSRIKKKCSG